MMWLRERYKSIEESESDGVTHGQNDRIIHGCSEKGFWTSSAPGNSVSSRGKKTGVETEPFVLKNTVVTHPRGVLHASSYFIPREPSREPSTCLFCFIGCSHVTMAKRGALTANKSRAKRARTSVSDFAHICRTNLFIHLTFFVALFFESDRNCWCK